MPDSIPTVFVVDPDASVRASLDILLRRSGWKAESFASAAAFLARAPLLVPNCLVLEIDLPDLDALDLVRRIAAERKQTPTIVMSAHADIPMAVQAMRAGAAELMMKPLVEGVVLSAVGQAIARSRAVLEQEAEMLELQKRHDSLSGRERDVMARVVAGLLNKQVGAVLGISEITVKAHRGRVMRKMGADSLAQLVSMAIRLCLPAVPTLRPLPIVSSRTGYRLTA